MRGGNHGGARWGLPRDLGGSTQGAWGRSRLLAFHSPDRALDAVARSLRQSFAHITFSTKERRPMITAEVESKSHAYHGGVIRELGETALAINGVEDNVRILARTPKSVADADFIRTLKTNSSRWMKSRFSGASTFAWQGGYGWFSVSGSNVEKVRGYIDRQEDHHKALSFKEEFIAFLERNGIGYDERFIWE